MKTAELKTWNYDQVMMTIRWKKCQPNEVSFWLALFITRLC